MNQSVQKALQLLDLFVEQPELGLGDIARLSGMPKPTVYRFLTTLEKLNFVKKVRHGEFDIRYKLGMKLLELGSVVAEQIELRNVAVPYMQQLSSDVEEVVHLTIREGCEAVYIEKVESNRAIRLFIRIGKRSPLYAGSGPKLLLAYMPDDEREAIIDNLILTPLTSYTITDKKILKEEIAVIRLRGFSISDSEQDEDTIGISFPLRDHTGQVIAALGVSGLRHRFDDSHVRVVKAKLRETAAAVSAELGFHEGRVEDET